MAKIRLIERYYFTPKENDIIIYNEINKNQIKESVEGKDFYGLAKINNVPISNYEKNNNGRIYPYVEWKKAVKENIKTYCFADHPEDGKETVNAITGIWTNIRVNENDVRGDLVVFDNDNGRTLLHCAKNGLCEFSTSGWGNLDENNTVYDFELERASDWVYNRSNPIAVITDKSKEVEILEKNEKKKQSFHIDETNINKNKQMEDGIVENTDLKQLNENMIKTQKNHIKKLIKESEKTENYADCIEELQNITPLSEELGNMISESVSVMSAKLSEKQTVIMEEAKQSKGKVEELTKTVKAQDKVINELKESLKKANTIIKSKKTDGKLKESLIEMAKDLDEVFYVLENKVIKQLGIEKPQEFVELAEDSIKMEKLLKQFKEKYKKLKESKETMTNDIKLKKLLKQYKESLDDAMYDLDVLAQILESKGINIDKEAKRILEKGKAKAKKKEADDEEVEDEEEVDDTEELEEEDEEDVEDSDDEDEEEVEEKSKKKKKKESRKKRYSEEDDDESDEEDEEDSEEEDEEEVEEKSKKKKESRKRYSEEDDEEDSDDEEEVEEEDEEDSEDEEDEEEVEEKSKKKKKKESSSKKISTKRLIEAFYKEKVKHVPSIKRIEKQIKNADSLTDAYKIVEKFTKPENEKISMKESIIKDSYDPFPEFE